MSSKSGQHIALLGALHICFGQSSSGLLLEVDLAQHGVSSGDEGIN
jgi:hypothetical protein